MSCDYCSLPPNRCQCTEPARPRDRLPKAQAEAGRGGRAALKLSEPVIPDHMHWYRVMGAVYLRQRRARQLDKLGELRDKL